MPKFSVEEYEVLRKNRKKRIKLYEYNPEENLLWDSKWGKMDIENYILFDDNAVLYDFNLKSILSGDTFYRCGYGQRHTRNEQKYEIEINRIFINEDMAILERVDTIDDCADCDDSDKIVRKYLYKVEFEFED